MLELLLLLNIVDKTRWHSRDSDCLGTEWYTAMCQYLHSI